ncbi:MAG TPA: lytic murein transglycosylase B [Xanthomonadales bacterium]|nr:lytic murein transglycosylase B [Xanthomonadales bacterium]
MIYRFSGLMLTALLTASCYAENVPQDHPGADEFAQRAEEKYGLPQADVIALLQQARYRQSIVDAMTRPAERKPWHEYRPIFITDRRIDGGVAFWRENQAAVEAAAEEFEVDPEVIVAIIGVETLYGRITGSYRVIDALATLSFYYPDTGNDRSDFFSDEFMQFMVLSQEEGVPLTEAEGSYAGAMGLGQFIPSSYRAYSVDMDGDGRRDLWSSLPDILGSVANYLHSHGWEYGQPVAVDAMAIDGADPAIAEKRNYKPEVTVAQLAESGYVTEADIDMDTLASVINLEEEDGDRLWLGFKNFYVITRYNRSPLYAMAVYELSQAILEGMEE